jgi:hypothetical protein
MLLGEQVHRLVGMQVDELGHIGSFLTTGFAPSSR